MTETKRDVLVDAVDALADAQASGGNIGHQDADLFMYDYDNALPDDLPVIPKEVGEYIERQKQGSTLRSAIIAASDFHAVDYEETEWIFYHSETFARAWLLGVWRVVETGEIVKLEAEK
ncbi:hypothetical protein AWC33_00470 [Lacticaseibacillus paracasei]|nr:hypothetical protein AWC33_00470 [Lacticaseibacillus paracasei]